MEGLVALGVIGVLLSVVLGFRTGMALQHARQAVKNHATAKAAMPGLRRTARSARLFRTVWFLATAFAVGLILALLVRNASG